MTTIELGELPALSLWSLRARVADESEIGEAVADLLPRLREELRRRGVTDVDIVLAYDGADDANAIIVTAGVTATDAAGGSGLTTVEVSSSEGVTVQFSEPPRHTGDAWLSLDTRLEAYGLETTGVYRQILTQRAGVILQAPVWERAAVS